MANYTKYYIAGTRNGKATKVFESNLHKAIKAARKIGLKPTSKDAFGYDAKTNKWENLSSVKTSRATTAKSLLKEGTERAVDNVKGMLKVGGKVLKATNYVMPAIKLMGEKIKATKSTMEANKLQKGLLNRFSKDLPSTIMGRTNYNTAVKKIKNYLDKGNYVGASNYMFDQLLKLARQTKGTGSYQYISDKLDDWYGKHLTW